MSAVAAGLLSKIESKSAVVGVLGLGYVGLPLVRAILDAGYRVIGYDIDQSKIDSIKAGRPYIHHLGQQFCNRLQREGTFEATTDPSALARADAILLCVPTPLGTHHEPDLTYVLDSTRLVAKTLRVGQLVVLESTTYPGTTRDEMGPILDASGLKRNEDYFLAYSPEREDPGSAGRSAAVIPKLVGGTDETSGRLAHALYSRIVAAAHLVSTAEIAESAKLVENIFRCVNIAMVNELKMVFDRMHIDVWEVIAAASTKPFGFMPFYPGPGLGGHCIPIDPFYLTWKAKEVGLPTRFIELAGEVNAHMPHWVVDKLQQALNEQGKAVKGAAVLVLGVAYKKNIDDGRETPAAEIIESLLERGASVSYHDPHIARFPRMRDHSVALESVPLTRERLAASDCVLIVTDHDAVDYQLVVDAAPLVVDTRHALARTKGGRARRVEA